MNYFATFFVFAFTLSGNGRRVLRVKINTLFHDFHGDLAQIK